MLKIFDCSNSVKRPQHRGGGGPLENDVVRQLKTHAGTYDACFIDDPLQADLIFTNDVYPDHILKIEKPRLKRMDGMFYRPGDSDRNSKYNKSALESNHVIFISEYARYSFNWLFDYNISSSVALNAADTDEFFVTDTERTKGQYVAAATDWDRDEKRLNALIKLSEFSVFNGNIVLIGKCERPLSDRFKKNGYCTQREMNNIFNSADAFINFSYRDPAPKVVCQALTAGLPVFYADSGGVRESVKTEGYGIKDPVFEKFEYNAPALKILDSDWITFLNNLDTYKKSLARRDFKVEYTDMIGHYFIKMHNLV